MCDVNITAQGGAEIDSIDTDDVCHPVVTMRHAAGCHIYNDDSIAVWREENSWFSAITLIVGGAVVAMLGKRWFPWVGGTFAAVGVLYTVVTLSGSLEWTESAVGMILTLLVGMALAIFIGSLIRRNIWLAFGITGVLCGFALGGIVYDAILAAVDWESQVGYFVIVGLFGLLGGALIFKFDRKIALLGTSFVGSYAFVRGWSFVIGGWPSQ